MVVVVVDAAAALDAAVEQAPAEWVGPRPLAPAATASAPVVGIARLTRSGSLATRLPALSAARP